MLFQKVMHGLLDQCCLCIHLLMKSIHMNSIGNIEDTQCDFREISAVYPIEEISY